MSSDDPNSSDPKPSADPNKADLRYENYVRKVEGRTEADSKYDDLATALFLEDTGPEATPDAPTRRGEWVHRE